MSVVLTALASFVCGFAVAWVFLWTAFTSAMSRQSDRANLQVGELHAQLRSFTGNSAGGTASGPPEPAEPEEPAGSTRPIVYERAI